MSQLFHCLLVAFVGVINLAIITVDGCVEPTGIGITGDEAGAIYNISQLSSLPIGTIFVRGLILVNVVYGDQNDEYETAIQFERLALGGLKRFNIMLAYETDALDFFGREDVTLARRRCQPDDDDEDGQLIFTYHRSVAFAYSMYFTYFFDKQTRLEAFTPIFESWGLNPDICDTEDCENDVSTPWGLAYQSFVEMETFEKYNGWNNDGSYSGREYNLIPYRDFRDENTRYTPVNSPWELEYPTRYQNLLETDDLGFLYYHEHSVPHIGYTGRSFYYSDDEFCERSDTLGGKNIEPNYDYDEEIAITLQRLADLTELQKVEIEYFDDKGGLLPFVGQYVVRRFGVNLDSIDYLKANLVALHSFYEAGIAVWKEKVDFDAVRPPSIVHELLGDQDITSYAGTTSDGATLGTQTFSASDWQPYIRTMPHSEYPSASACVCEAFAEAMETLFGDVSFTTQLGSPLTTTVSAFSSEYEPLSTPSVDTTLSYDRWSEISDRCGESRLEGGMHFSASVPSGRKLCQGIGEKIATYVNDILNGIKPDFTLDITDTEIRERDCYPSSSSSSDSSRSSSGSSRSSSSRGSSGSSSKSSSRKSSSD